jgi:hypothetical protein
MGEQRYELKPFGVRYVCKCGNEMEYTGQMLMSDPPQFVHLCNECNSKENLREKYPTVRWEAI